MERWGIHHVVTSPYYSQSNGHADAAVKAVKHLMLKTALSGNVNTEMFARCLLKLRNVPTYTGRSPSQHLFGCPLRSCVPAHQESFSKEWQAKTEDCDSRAAARAAQEQARYDQHARSFPELSVGETVRIQDLTSLRWDKVGVIISRGEHRKCEVRLPAFDVFGGVTAGSCDQ